MATDPKERTVTALEVAVFTTALFEALEVRTIGELCDVSERRFLAEGKALAAQMTDAPDEAPAKSLREVSSILGDMGLRLKPEIPGGRTRRCSSWCRRKPPRPDDPAGWTSCMARRWCTSSGPLAGS